MSVILTRSGVRNSVACVQRGASREVATELVLLAAGPGPDCAVHIESEGVVGAKGGPRDVTQADDSCWHGLLLDDLPDGVMAEASFIFRVLMRPEWTRH